MIDLGALWKSQAPRLLAALVQRFKQLQLAEDVLAHAFEKALTWTAETMPQDPMAWLYQTAVNAGIDQVRREQLRVSHRMAHLQQLAAVQSAQQLSHDESERAASRDHTTIESAPDFEESSDNRLALFFLCAHPSLSRDSQAMLMLRFCACIPVTDIARWFDQDGETVQRRLHRAKQKLEQSGARFEMPPSDQWRERLPPVLSAIEILYDQSYSNVAGGVEQDGFAREGEQLALQLCAHLTDPEALGLAALIVFAESRRAARLDAQHVMVPLSHQDCARWDGLRIATAAKLLKRAASMNQPGPYQLRALISAQHARRAQLGHTPWHEICELYEHLVALPDVADLSVWLNQALAIGERDGAAAGLQRLQSIDATWSVESLPTRLKLARLLASAHLLELAQNEQEARTQREAALALDRAHSLLGAAERAWIERQIACPGVGARPAGSSTAVI